MVNRESIGLSLRSIQLFRIEIEKHTVIVIIVIVMVIVIVVVVIRVVIDVIAVVVFGRDRRIVETSIRRTLATFHSLSLVWLMVLLLLVYGLVL
jgi:hypothetical protein